MALRYVRMVAANNFFVGDVAMCVSHSMTVVSVNGDMLKPLTRQYSRKLFIGVAYVALVDGAIALAVIRLAASESAIAVPLLEDR